LLAVCLKKIKGLSKTKIINAVWVWTEPHSKRLKIAVDIEKPVLDGKMNIQQRVIIEYIVRNKQCLECIREASDHSWGAMIQLRQKSDHKSSLMALETLLTRAGLHNIMLGAEVSKNGMDFYFRNRSQAEKLVNFISSNLPTKIKQSQRLVSTDSHSGQSKYEHVYLIEVPSLCKGDLVKVGKSGGVPAELMVVSKVSTSLHLISPTTLRKLEISSSKFFSNPIKAIRSSYQQVMFVVLDIEPVNPSDMSTMRSNEYDYDESTLKTNAYSTAGGLLAEAEVCVTNIVVLLYTVYASMYVLRM
jgi:nonsense-mediated mRNA decay protein 3